MRIVLTSGINIGPQCSALRFSTLNWFECRSFVLGGKGVSVQDPFTAAWSALWAWQRGEVIVSKTSALLLEFS